MRRSPSSSAAMLAAGSRRVQTLSAQQLAAQASARVPQRRQPRARRRRRPRSSGAVVRGLTADDFELLEDGVRQQILTFAFEEITSAPRRRSRRR